MLEREHGEGGLSIVGVTKESLAARPINYVVQSNQKYLRIGYDLAGGHLTLKQQGVEVEKLPPVPAAEAVICQNKMVDTSTADMRYVYFYLLVDAFFNFCFTSERRLV